VRTIEILNRIEYLLPYFSIRFDLKRVQLFEIFEYFTFEYFE